MNLPDETNNNNVNCPECEKVNEKSAKFCESCGAKLRDALQNNQVIINDKKCPNCKKDLEKSNKFCDNCGHDLTQKQKKPDANEMVCPKCKQPFEIGSKFCGNCKHELSKKEQVPPIDEPAVKPNVVVGTKKCPVCTFECKATLNFCEVCNHKF